jgi:MoxR-like ATPase
MIAYAATVEISDEMSFYIVDLIHASRTDPTVSTGGSPRASIAVLKSARALAAVDGRQQVLPDDVRAVLGPVLAHRLQLQPEALLRGETVEQAMERVIAAVKPPLLST